MKEKNGVPSAVLLQGFSVGSKIGVIVIITLLLLIPISMVESLIEERGHRQNEAVDEISNKWGGSQTIGGPILSIPYRSYIQEKEKQPRVITRYAHFLPDSLEIKGSMEPELLYRGIYEALLYTADLQIRGSFSFPDMKRFNIPAEDILWEKAILSMGITDMGGIKAKIAGNVAGKALELEPGIETGDVYSSGVSSRIILSGGEEVQFSFDIGVNGNRELLFLPLGKETRVNLTSNWPAPSFAGHFLPAHRKIDTTGFAADWLVLDLNRNFPQSFLGGKKGFCEAAFGVSLHSGADVYQKTMRTAKYGVMFILFTFTAFFLSEVILATRVHPVQYLLVGCAVILFYVLLVAFSEHLGFNSSFLISALAVVLLVSGYTRSILNKKMGAAVLMILVILYSYLFITLQLEDYALMVGSLGLFATLSVVMYLTRGINWYVLGGSAAERETQNR